MANQPLLLTHISSEGSETKTAPLTDYRLELRGQPPEWRRDLARRMALLDLYICWLVYSYECEGYSPYNTCNS